MAAGLAWEMLRWLKNVRATRRRGGLRCPCCGLLRRVGRRLLLWLLLRWLLHWLRLRGRLLMRRVRGLPTLWFCIDWRVLAEDSCESAAEVLERGAHIPLRKVLMINEARIVDVHVALA
jgi:hypothetical protein